MNIKRLNNKIDYISKFLNKKFNKKISNKSEFIKDSYYLNKLIHDFYLISKSNLTKTQKINKLANQTDPYGQKIINKRIAKQLLEDNSRDIIKLYDKLYSYKINQKSNRNITGGAQMVQDVNQQFNNLNNSLGKNLNTVKFKDYINLQKGTGINRYIPKPVTDVAMFMINWLFFPLWSLENLPIAGKIIEIPLDIMGIVIDNFDIVMENAGSSVTMAIDILLDILQAVPVVGSFASAAALPMNFLEKPIEYAIENGTDIIGMFFNLSRKQFGLAYVSSLSAIPYLTDIVDAIVTNLFTANKFLSKLNSGLSKISGLCERADGIITTITENAKQYQTMFSAILDNPKILYDVDMFINQVVIPSKNAIPILRDMSDKEFQVFVKNIKPLFQKFINDPFYFLAEEDRIYDELIKPFKSKIPTLKNIPKKDITNKIYNYINIALNQVNDKSTFVTNNLQSMALNTGMINI